MDRWDLVKHDGQWYQQGDGKRIARGPRKEEAIQKTARAAERAKRPITVKIHKASGQFDEERTYPRSADPHKSKG